MAHMSVLPAWRVKLEGSLHKHQGVPHARYVQLATLRPDGRPAVRTLVFRSLLDAGHHLVFTADTRSDKCVHLSAEQRVEVCWYFVNTREQYRVAGRGSLIAQGGDKEMTEVRLCTWRGMSEDARQTFTWPQPGELRAVIEEFERAVPDDPPPNFALLIVVPEEVDHLELGRRPHQRTLHNLADDGQWVCRLVNP